jgi:hypothetical protein
LTAVEDPGMDRKLEPAVAATLAELALDPADQAVSRLALHLARTIDRAEAIAAQARKIPFEPDSADEVKRLAARVSAQATASDLGPKLLAALDALGATPKARAQSGGKPAGLNSTAATTLAAMRGGA